ncbi:hypothetical protein [Mycolicibacterium palauense]|uniref:hypothetical protein n=1 Tax=Mycolicibacterium palauense TaxID=2034511 RepID=UPI000BFEF563|nr:hypothetical protein [Mycolicibacterium palauense]
MTWDDDAEYVYTEMNPYLLDTRLDKNSYLVDKWDKMIAWHRAQARYFETQHALKEAEATMRWGGAVGKAKAYAQTEPAVIDARIKMDIAHAQLGLCERRIHSLEKDAINLALRNKLLNIGAFS